MARASSEVPGPGQEMAVQIIELAQRIVDQGNSVTIRWAPAHRGVEGNERTDAETKERAVLPPLGATRQR